MQTFVAAVVMFVAGLAPQGRPNFSGEWVLEKDRSSQTMQGRVVTSVVGLLGDAVTAIQDSKTLELRITVSGLNRTVRAIYNLDGSVSHNLNPQGPGQDDEPITSTVAWDGNQLVIQTKGTILVDGKPLESKRVIWMDAEGLLTVERSSAGQPTTRSVYRRAR